MSAILGHPYRGLHSLIATMAEINSAEGPGDPDFPRRLDQKQQAVLTLNQRGI